jgi:hypothetical protein
MSDGAFCHYCQRQPCVCGTPRCCICKAPAVQLYLDNPGYPLCKNPDCYDRLNTAVEAEEESGDR